MILQSLSYQDIIFNHFLKILVVVMFLIGTLYFYRAGKKFRGNMGRIAHLLFWCGIAGFVGAGCRYLGDYSAALRWLESIGDLFFAIVSAVVAYLVYKNFAEIARVFGLTERSE